MQALVVVSCETLNLQARKLRPRGEGKGPVHWLPLVSTPFSFYILSPELVHCVNACVKCGVTKVT